MVRQKGDWVTDVANISLQDVEINAKDASKPVARHFDLPNHSFKHCVICFHRGNTETYKLTVNKAKKAKISDDV